MNTDQSQPPPQPAAEESVSLLAFRYAAKINFMAASEEDLLGNGRLAEIIQEAITESATLRPSPVDAGAKHRIETLLPLGKRVLVNQILHLEEIIDELRASRWRRPVAAAGVSDGARAWIPTSEREPEQGVLVLIVFKIGTSRHLAFASREWEQGFTPEHWRDDNGARWELSDVTHWQPLPALPAAMTAANQTEG